MGAHSDDIEIGCGGTILRLLSEYDDVEVHWVVLGSSGQRDGEAVTSAKKFLAGAKKKKIIIENFKDSFFPYIGGEIKNFFEKLKMRASPDIIFTHYRHDLHQDHRLLSELTWNTYRDHLILEYEIIKYDGDLGNPNFFVHLDEATCQKKIRLSLWTLLSPRRKKTGSRPMLSFRYSEFEESSLKHPKDTQKGFIAGNWCFRRCPHISSLRDRIV